MRAIILTTIAWLIGLALLKNAHCEVARPGFYEADPGCAPILQATVNLERHANDLTVPVEVNGKILQFVLDLGNSDTAILEQGQSFLKAATTAGPVNWKENVPEGVRPGKNFAILDTLAFAGKRVARRLVPIRDFGYEDGSDAKIREMGVIGTDMLIDSDLDLDIPRMKLSIYRFLSGNDCPILVPPWKRSFTRIYSTLTPQRTLSVPLEVDNTSIPALFDTGSSQTSIHWRSADLLHLSNRAEAREEYPVEATNVSFGSIKIRSLVLLARSKNENARSDGNSLLGMDIIDNHHFWISFSSRQIIVEDK